MTKKTIASKAFRFSPEELELLERLAATHGSYKDTVMAALHALDEQKEPSNATLIRMLKERLG
jgi:hypothetical protein